MAAWRVLACALLMLVNAGVSSLLLLQHHRVGAAVSAVNEVCGEGAQSGCETVARSSWSEVAGIPLAAASGARRTETAYERFLDDTEAFDVLIVNGGTTPDNLNRQFDFDELASRPEVAEAARLNYYLPEGLRPDGLPLTSSDLLPVAPVDGAFWTEVNEVRILSGRLPEGQDEIALTPLAADEAGAAVGEELDRGREGAAGGEHRVEHEALAAGQVVGEALGVRRRLEGLLVAHHAEEADLGGRQQPHHPVEHPEPGPQDRDHQGLGAGELDAGRRGDRGHDLVRVDADLAGRLVGQQRD